MAAQRDICGDYATRVASEGLNGRRSSAKAFIDSRTFAPLRELSATLENEADATLENEATGSLVSSLPCLGF